MKSEAAWNAEWAILKDRRACVRRRLRRAAAGLSERVRDPFGLGALVRKHPVASAGIGAAAGALLGGLLLGSARGSRKDGGAAPEAAPAPPPPDWVVLLRDAALGVAVPWLLRTLGKGAAATGDAVPGTPAPADQRVGESAPSAAR